jgi:hypothetical protein
MPGIHWWGLRGMKQSANAQEPDLATPEEPDHGMGLVACPTRT